MLTGTETSTAFLHAPRTATRFGSMSNASATRRSWLRAISKGFSRRCETPASTVVTGVSFSEVDSRIRVYDRSSEGKSELSPARRPAVRRVGEDDGHVPAWRKRGAAGAAAGEPERVHAREHVADAREETEARAAGTAEEHVEAGERADFDPSARGDQASGLQGEERGTRVGRSECSARERCARDEVDLLRVERKRPWDADRSSAGDGPDHGSVGGLVADRAGRGQRIDVHEDAVARTQHDARRMQRELDGGGAFVLRSDPERDLQLPRGEIRERERGTHPPAGCGGRSQ